MRSLLQARKGENAEKHSKLLTNVDNSASYMYSPSLWILSPLSGRCSKRRQYCSLVNVQSIKIKCGNNLCVQRCDIYAPIPSACRFCNVTKFTTNRYQSISINLSIVIGNRYQSITTRIFAIDWSSIININRLIDIDWY